MTEKVPKAFIWHTFTDGSVPVENSLMFVSALRKAGVKRVFDMFAVGGHGVGLAYRLTENPGGRAIQEECTSWITLVKTWLEKQFVETEQGGNRDSLS